MIPHCQTCYGRLQHVLLAIPNPGALDVDPKVAMFKEQASTEGVRDQLLILAAVLQELGVKVTAFNYDGRFPNMVFLRDLAVVLDSTVWLAKPFHDIRKGEEQLLAEQLWRMGAPLCMIRQPHYFRETTMEGADVLYTNHHLWASVGNRTSMAAVAYDEYFGEGRFGRLPPPRGLRTVHALPEGIPQHLLGHKQLLAYNWLLSRSELSPETLGCTRVTPVAETPEVVDGLAMNILVLEPGVILMPSGCPDTQAYYESQGIHVYTVPMHEVHKMGGGLACAVLPLVRSS